MECEILLRFLRAILIPEGSVRDKMGMGNSNHSRKYCLIDKGDFLAEQSHEAILIHAHKREG